MDRPQYVPATASYAHLRDLRTQPVIEAPVRAGTAAGRSNALMLALIGIVIVMLAKHIGPDGRVPSSDALGLTALLLSFREIIASIRGIFDGADRADLTGKLAASSPVAPPAVEPDPTQPAASAAPTA